MTPKERWKHTCELYLKDRSKRPNPINVWETFDTDKKNLRSRIKRRGVHIVWWIRTHLYINPNESLALELKDYMDLNDNEDDSLIRRLDMFNKFERAMNFKTPEYRELSPIQYLREEVVQEIDCLYAIVEDVWGPESAFKLFSARPVPKRCKGRLRDSWLKADIIKNIYKYTCPECKNNKKLINLNMWAKTKNENNSDIFICKRCFGKNPIDSKEAKSCKLQPTLIFNCEDISKS